MKIDPCSYFASSKRELGNTCKSPKVDKGTITALRARLPEFLAVLGVELRKNGPRLLGRCPVHDDSSPSFAVFGTHQEICGCFPCGFSGDVFQLSRWLGRSSSFRESIVDVTTTLGVNLPQLTADTARKPALVPKNPTKNHEPPFVLSATDREILHTARLAFCDAFHAGKPIVDDIAASLRIDRETLRLASWGSSGLGLADGWLCYAYPQGLKWRNPDPAGNNRFRWIAGKALAPWRMEWVKTNTGTVFVTEGESDCLALIAAGLEADGDAACVASPGTSFSRAWAPLFKGKRVVLCFDADPAGRAATATVAAILKGHAAEILSWKGLTVDV